MRTRRNAPALALATVAMAAAALALAGCVQTPTHVIPTAEPTTKPVFASDAAALAAAKKAYVAYLAVSDQILIDGGKNPNRLLTVATPSELKAQQAGFASAASKGWTSTGGTQIDQIALQEFDPSAPSGRSIVTVYACIDVSHVDVTDSSGASVVSPSRPTKSAFQATFDWSKATRTHLLLSSELPWSGKGICES